MLIYIKLNKFFVGIKINSGPGWLFLKERFNIEETFIVGKCVCLKDEIGTNLKICFNSTFFLDL